MRAAQTAAFHLGWLLQVNLERLSATAEDPSAAVAASADTWHTLRLYREPHLGAVCVLAALGLDMTTMLALPGTAVSADGAAVTVDGVALPTPPGSAVLLRAQRFAGQLAGRSPDAPFLHDHGRPVDGDQVHGALRAAFRDTGVQLLSRKLGLVWGRDWLTRWGLSVQEVS